MKIHNAIYLCVVLALALASLTSGYQEGLNVQKRGHNLRTARATDQDADTHGEEDDHAHEEDENSQCAVTSATLAHEFSELAEELQLLGEDGEPCRVEEEEDEDHHHEEEEEELHLDHDSLGSGDVHIENGTCGQWYGFTRQLLLRLNLTMPCCLGNTSECEPEVPNPGGNTRTPTAQAYGYGFLLVVLVCLGSLLGLVLLPVAKSSRLKQYYQYAYALLISLGASALFCDAILHLIPEAFGLHDHEVEAEGDGHAHSEEEGEDELLVVWRSCMVILGMYAFFLFEFTLHSWVGHSHSATPSTSQSQSGSNEMIDLKNNANLDESEKGLESGGKDTNVLVNPGAEGGQMRELTLPHGECHHATDRGNQLGMGLGLLHPPKKSCGNKDCEKEDNVNCCKMFGRYLFGIKPLAWLIILGDGFHNFADGLALGSAISQSLSLGISTTIAIVFHEIPHEIGDYFILLSTGMTWYVALFFNFVSSLTAIIGFFVGVAIGTSSEDANSWILAAAAGIFLYIALVDLLPELIHSKEKGCKRQILFIMVNIGFVISFIALLLLAIYEEPLNNLIEV